MHAFGFHRQIARGFLQENEPELAKGAPEILRVRLYITQGSEAILRKWMVNDGAVFHPGELFGIEVRRKKVGQAGLELGYG